VGSCLHFMRHNVQAFSDWSASLTRQCASLGNGRPASLPFERQSEMSHPHRTDGEACVIVLLLSCLLRIEVHLSNTKV
jgi:hypothetical protein